MKVMRCLSDKKFVLSTSTKDGASGHFWKRTTEGKMSVLSTSTKDGASGPFGDQCIPGGFPVVFAVLLRGAQRFGLRGSMICTWSQGLVSWRRR